MKQQTKDPKWPFSVSYPTTKPTPWTAKQIKEYNQQQQAKIPDAPF
jgi:hypothetical protein